LATIPFLQFQGVLADWGASAKTSISADTS
jgi:hypothetical protein